TLIFRYSAEAGEASRYLAINGESIVDEVRFSGTSSWGDWQTLLVNKIPMSEGQHTVSLIFDSSKNSQNWLNYDSLIITEKADDELYNWQREALVDSEDGFVWDGINRTGDGNIDKNWAYTYKQGVYIGASVELYRITNDSDYLNEAIQTAETAKNLFSNHYQKLYED